MNNPSVNRRLLQSALLAASVAGAASPVPKTYQPMGVLDFIIDGPTLAARGASVDVYGTYVREGAVDVLYADTTAVARARTWPQAPPHVVVITDSASRGLRAKLIACQTDPMTAQIGCKVAVRGHAATCEVTSATAVPRREPCIEAESETPAPDQTF